MLHVSQLLIMLKEESDQLIHIMATNLQCQHALPPLSSKILASIIIEGQPNGLTFEYFVERFQASKSSVSTSLKQLLDQQRIYFTSDPGKRKKFFKAFPLSDLMAKRLKNIQLEKETLEKIIEIFNNSGTDHEFRCDIENMKLYQDYLENVMNITNSMLEILKKKEQKNIINNLS